MAARPRPRPAAGAADATAEPGPGQGKYGATIPGREAARAPGIDRALGPGPAPPPACCRGDGSAVTDGAPAQCPGRPVAAGQWQQRLAARALPPRSPRAARPRHPPPRLDPRSPPLPEPTAPLPAAGGVTRCGRLGRRPCRRLPRWGEACRKRGRQNPTARPCLLPAAVRTGRLSPAARPVPPGGSGSRPRRDTDPACASGARSSSYCRPGAGSSTDCGSGGCRRR